MNSYYKFIHINSPILVQRLLYVSLTIVWYHHPLTPKYCRKNSNYTWNVFFRFGTKKFLFLGASWKIIVKKLINLLLLLPLNSQPLIKNKKSRLIILALKVRMITMGTTKVKIVSNDFLQALCKCPPIHWPSLMLNDPKICFCPCSHITEPWREKKKVSIHPNQGCKTENMTPMQSLNHLEREGDSTHKAILVYLNQLSTFQRGPTRHIPSKGVSVSLFLA
jgi:hypothetical protein